MKKIWMPVILLAAATSGRAAEKRAPDIIVFFRAINENVRIVRFAETQAGHMLAAAGITVAWRTGSPDYHGRAEVIEAVLTDQPDESAHRGALAFAMLGQQYGPRTRSFIIASKSMGAIPRFRPSSPTFWCTRLRTFWRV